MVGANSVRPFGSPVQTLRYPHNGRYIVSNTLRHDIFQHGSSTQICEKLKSRRSERANAVRPYIYADSLSCRKIAALFADFVLCRRVVKAVQVLCFDICFAIGECLVFFFCFSAPLSRLAPIEALPISCERSRTRNLLRQGLCP